MSDEKLTVIDLDQLAGVHGGNDLWDATKGAFNIVTSPIRATVRGVEGVVRARQQGHSWGDSISNGLVRAADITSVPDLGNIPANPNPPVPANPPMRPRN
jgi:hypothetical protein